MASRQQILEYRTILFISEIRSKFTENPEYEEGEMYFDLVEEYLHALEEMVMELRSILQEVRSGNADNDAINNRLTTLTSTYNNIVQEIRTIISDNVVRG